MTIIRKMETQDFTNNKKATHPSLEIHGRSLKDNEQHLTETSSTDAATRNEDQHNLQH